MTSASASESAQPILPLAGRSALVTGVSRRRGIGYAVALRFAELGANVFIHHFAPHDTVQSWGGDDLDAVRDGIRSSLAPGARFGDASADLSLPGAAAELVRRAAEELGQLHLLVCNHARSGADGSIFDMTAERLDGHWQVNARSTLLLTRAFAEQFGSAAPTGAVEGVTTPTAPGVRQTRAEPIDEFSTGRVFWMTSGQLHGAMPGEVAYAASKAALAGVTPTVASDLLAHGIILNTIDPGPVNTGYLDPETTDRPLDGIQEQVV